ncbi:hypothetical protein [Brenneria goodwinii]|uniref:hypothetical protein n=2 Tax=Brenneria goodwinii TaxID=1109412 RepID=UPI0036F23D45
MESMTSAPPYVTASDLFRYPLLTVTANTALLSAPHFSAVEGLRPAHAAHQAVKAILKRDLQ